MNSFALPLSLSPLLLLAAPASPLPAPGEVQKGGEPRECTQITFSDGYGPDDALWASPGSAPRIKVPKAVLGAEDTLTQVIVTVSGSATGSLGIENTTGAECVAFPEWSISLGILPTAPMPGLSLVPFESSQLLTAPLEAFDGVLDYSGDSGNTIVLPGTLAFEEVFTLTTGLSGFIDSAPADGQPEFVEFDHFALGSGTARSTCGVDSEWSAEATFDVTFEYTICSQQIVCPTGTVLTSTADSEQGKHERAILYGVRDKQLSKSPLGRDWMRRFYAHAQEAHVLFMNSPELRRRAAELLREILPTLGDAAEGRPAELSTDQLRKIHALLRDLTPHASVPLQKTLTDLRRGLRSGDLTEIAGLGK